MLKNAFVAWGLAPTSLELKKAYITALNPIPGLMEGDFRPRDWNRNLLWKRLARGLKPNSETGHTVSVPQFQTKLLERN